MFSEIRKRVQKIGQPPGSAFYTGDDLKSHTHITLVTYNKSGSNLEEYQDEIPSTLNEILQGKDYLWINVKGLANVETIKKIANIFELHPLTVEDILNVEQRPKVEEFSNYIFITIKVLDWAEKNSTFTTRQVSIVLGKKFVLSFQDSESSRFDSILKRLKKGTQKRILTLSSDYLAYRLIDAVVDEYFIVLEAVGDEIEEIEEIIIATPTTHNSRNIYKLKRMLLMLRKIIWPMREAVGHLLHIDNIFISKHTNIYFRDVYDHTMQAIDTLETFRDMISSLLDMYLSILTNRMNEIMKTLTIISTIFIPITCIASIYGMNFYNLPGINAPYGYVSAIAAMIIVALIMIIYFLRKHWIQR